MTLLDKLDRLMELHGLNKHSLSEQCGLPYTTITGMYTRGTDKLQLLTLQKLCDFFHVSLDYMAYDKYDNPSDFTPSTVNENPISPGEETLIKKYRAIDERGRENVENTLESEYQRAIKKEKSFGSKTG